MAYGILRGDALLVAKNSGCQDRGGKPLTDSPLTESGVAGIWMSRIWKEEKNTVIGLFISVLAGMLLITTIWKMITQKIFLRNSG